MVASSSRAFAFKGFQFLVQRFELRLEVLVAHLLPRGHAHMTARLRRHRGPVASVLSTPQIDNSAATHRRFSSVAVAASFSEGLSSASLILLVISLGSRSHQRQGR
jgi:hypothetical protein